MIIETLRGIAGTWKDVRGLAADVDRLAKAAEGLDGRRIRKAIFAAAASDVETAKDLNNLRTAQIEAAFRQALKTSKELEQ
jgi:AAA+ superfamily predicted ATPase